ncbi:helix-turn-helix transcriptional regulator [Oscillospiraceae bacterium OttesenSCG-928-F05]|nr:helix-turn-helix transcriptional regulator [Oscillospiraceae bacterium OttesenSCG-928-F05]
MERRTTRLRRMRMECSITLREMADKAGVSHQRFFEIEHGRCAPENRERIIRACEAVIDDKLCKLRLFKEMCTGDANMMFDVTKEGDAI